MFVRIRKPANLLLLGFRHYRATPLLGQLQYRTTAGSTKCGRMRLLRGPAHPFKDLDTAKGFLRGSHSWGEAGFEPGTSALRRPDATIALPGHPLVLYKPLKRTSLFSRIFTGGPEWRTHCQTAYILTTTPPIHTYHTWDKPLA